MLHAGKKSAFPSQRPVAFGSGKKEWLQSRYSIHTIKQGGETEEEKTEEVGKRILVQPTLPGPSKNKHHWRCPETCGQTLPTREQMETAF